MASLSRISPDRAVLAGFILTAAVYCRDVRYDFILDDLPLIMMNETIASWHNWKHVFMTDINSTVGGSRLPAMHYRPVYVLWLMLNQQLFGSVLPWWHLTSLLLHLGVTLLVYRLGIVLLKEPWTAALAAVLFAFHPIHLESVSYVSASTDLLAALFVLISFLLYFRFREPCASPAYLIISVFAAALAMLSKETAAIFPWLLVAYEALRERPPGVNHVNEWPKRFVWTLPFFAVVAAYAAVRTLLFGLNLGPGPGGDRLGALRDVPLVLLVYVRNLVWSFHLSFFYPVEWSSQWNFTKAFAVALVVMMAAFLWRRYQDRPGVRLQLLWTAILFVIPLTGVSTFVMEDWVHDRHMYMVSIPICLIVAAVLTDRKISPKVSVIASSLVLLVLLVETTVQLPRFYDEITLYQSTLKVAPHNALAHRYYATVLWNFGRHEEALQEYRVTTELWPGSPMAHEAYAAALAEINRDHEAETEYRKALEYSPGHTASRSSILYRLAMIEVKNSNPGDAASHLREALQIDPRALNYHAALAQALRQQGREQEADEEMRMEVSVDQQFLHGRTVLKN
jgi:protein O-mannosyl-transferase